jgi:ABC-2 type transport system permease protein
MWGRILAIILRHAYLHRRNPARVMEVFFWPIMDLLVWGFITQYLESQEFQGGVLFFIGAMILWDLLYRSQQAISLSMTEEFWVRNFVNIFVSPLSIPEFVSALCIVGFIKSALTTLLLGILALLLYGFDLTSLGMALAPFYLNLLLFGWAVGLFTMGIILRYGRAAEALIWGMPFLLQPLTAVFYPVTILPGFLQVIAMCLPATYVFEGMRTVLRTGAVDWPQMGLAMVLNVFYLVIGAVFFGWMIRVVKEKGYLSRQNLQ